MLTLLFGLTTGCIVYFVLSQTTSVGNGWSLTLAVISMFLFQLAVMLILRKVSAKINAQLQVIMQETSNKLRAMQNQFMRRPVGNQKTMVQIMEKEQNAGLQRLLDALVLYKPLYPWNMLMKKQVNTMRMIFLFQMKKFEEADALLDKCVYFDVQSVCIRMTRMYKRNEDPKLIDKFFRKKAAKFKGQDSVLPYALYSWILVKQERIEEAIKLLVTAKVKTSDNEVIVKNWEMLVNGKVKHFSNAQLGELWYALMLEEPKMPRIQQQQVRYRR